MRQFRIVMLSTLALVILLGAGTANALPMFARKLGVPCQTCHTTIPVLNEVGYKFRAAGYRMPDQIGKAQDQKFELGDYFSARLQARYDAQVTNQPNGVAAANLLPSGAAGPRTSTNSFNFQEFTLYPLTGSWGKYFGSLSELSVSPEDYFEIENAYLRVVMGNEKNFFTSRIGIFHPWEGFGASDRPYSNARTLFQTAPISASYKGIPFLFQPWGLDEAGVEIGGDFNKLSVRAAILGGTFMRWDEEAQAFLAFPAQTGPWKGANQAVAALGKSVNSAAHSTPDFSAQATYILHPDGGGISLLYYRGNMSTPSVCVNDAGTLTKIGSTAVIDGKSQLCAGSLVDMTDRSTLFRNNLDRVAAYASYPIGKHFLPMGGVSYGRDSTPLTYDLSGTGAAVTSLRHFDSKGAFAEGVYHVGQYVTTGFRYDWFHPNFDKHNTQWAVTPYVNIALLNGFQVIAEYQHRDFQLDLVHHRQNDTFQARLIFVK
ncbi:MAG: hypothetical protein LAN59_00135 [Acidobacteriia bacterium]|nr:hypothetical protein [Terriglobia bacterium]